MTAVIDIVFLLIIFFLVVSKFIDTEDFPSDVSVLDKAIPKYTELSGWDEEIGDVREFKKLPKNAIKYIEKLEEILGIPAVMISVGPDREEIITIKHPFGS